MDPTGGNRSGAHGTTYLGSHPDMGVTSNKIQFRTTDMKARNEAGMQNIANQTFNHPTIRGLASVPDVAGMSTRPGRSPIIHSRHMDIADVAHNTPTPHQAPDVAEAMLRANRISGVGNSDLNPGNVFYRTSQGNERIPTIVDWGQGNRTMPGPHPSPPDAAWEAARSTLGGHPGGPTNAPLVRAEQQRILRELLLRGHIDRSMRPRI